jgi:predicted peptidase
MGMTFAANDSGAAPARASLTPQSFEAEVTLKVGGNYLLCLPESYDASQPKEWPLLVFLHGASERGDDLDLLKKHGPPKLIAAGRKFDAVVACPQVPAKGVWDPHGVKALVDTLKRRCRVDEDRVYLTGISIGGFGTWETMGAYPEVFAAAIRICGGTGTRAFMADRIKDIPAWIFHGEADPIVPVDYSRRIYEQLKRAGGHPKVTIYPGVEHDSWTRTYDSPLVWEWLFEQRRGRQRA